MSATSLNLHTGDGNLTGSMGSEQDYSLELMFSGVNENSKFIKINNAKLESHSYQMDYAGMLSAQYAFNFECNEATGMAVKWGQGPLDSTGVLFSSENLQLRSFDGSGLSYSPEGTYEVTIMEFLGGYAYATEPDDPAYVFVINKTASERWMFVLNVPDSSFPGAYYVYDYYESVTIDTAWTAVQVATAIYNAAVTAGFNVTIDGATLTFTASQAGNLTNALGTPNPTITDGSP